MANSKRKRVYGSATTNNKAARLLREIRRLSRSPNFQKRNLDLLLRLCRINTTPNPDVSRMRAAEDGCFSLLERGLRQLHFSGAHLERRPIRPEIEMHPNYSLLHFTKTAERPRGLSAKETYEKRSNLLYVVPASEARGPGLSVALNAHVDVVAPYFPPRVKSGTIYGRGSCDDKGPVVTIVAALRLLSAAMAKAGLTWRRNLVVMFVVEEETGGNGSLSLATDRELKKLYDSILVCECTALKIFPANRGAVWYRAELKPLPSVCPVELFAFINEELEKEGASIRAESRHPLFPQRPVQTCHGIIGPYGEHPSRICGEVSFWIQCSPDKRTEALVRDCLDAGLASYVGLYGDKTKVIEPSTGKPMVKEHMTVTRETAGFRVDVHGATGHMGAIRERDGAITKMAHLIRSLVFSKARVQSTAPFRLVVNHGSGPLVLEGGQGFVPTHSIDEIMLRMREAAQRGAENYLRRIGRSDRGKDVVNVTYEKLHNVAFDGDPNSPSMRNAAAAARTCGFWKDEPVLGWTVSCDARLFASEYPGMDVLTFGPGQLAHAHSDREQITLEEMRAAAEFLAIFLLRQTGTI